MHTKELRFNDEANIYNCKIKRYDYIQTTMRTVKIEAKKINSYFKNIYKKPTTSFLRRIVLNEQ